MALLCPIDGGLTDSFLLLVSYLLRFRRRCDYFLSLSELTNEEQARLPLAS